MSEVEVDAMILNLANAVHNGPREECEYHANVIRAHVADLEGKVRIGNARFEQTERDLYLKLQAEESRREEAEAELEAVMLSVDKWLPEGYPGNPATRACDAREVALKAIEGAEAGREQWRLSRIETAKQRDRFELDLLIERKRTKRLRAVIEEAEHLALKGVRDINDGTWISGVVRLLRTALDN